MTDRIQTLCAALPKGKKLADVGCDHGYCAEFALKNGLFERVYISDISAGSLRKAETLLQGFIESGRCIPVLADGMKGLPQDCDCVLIAGLGGEEIVRILKEGYIPPKFVLQPMKNPEKVRAFLLKSGCRITSDYTFGEGYYYDLIAGENAGGDRYSEWEITYGRDNLRAPTPSFIHKLEDERAKLRTYLARKNMQRENREELRARLENIEVVLHSILNPDD